VPWNRESRGGGRGSAALPPQALRASVSIGRLRMRLPVAAKMALHSAGAAPLHRRQRLVRQGRRPSRLSQARQIHRPRRSRSRLLFDTRRGDRLPAVIADHGGRQDRLRRRSIRRDRGEVMLLTDTIPAVALRRLFDVRPAWIDAPRQGDARRPNTSAWCRHNQDP
jgi:hypothetical protein